jgi:predicted metal-dependent peptidase
MGTLGRREMSIQDQVQRDRSIEAKIERLRSRIAKELHGGKLPSEVAGILRGMLDLLEDEL